MKTLIEANGVLKNLLPDFNRRFSVPAQQSQPVFRKRPLLSQLDRILCLKNQRTVSKDHTVSFEGLILQIPPSKTFRSIAGQRVEVLQLHGGEIEIVYKDQAVAHFCVEEVMKCLEKNKGIQTTLKKVV